MATCCLLLCAAGCGTLDQGYPSGAQASQTYNAPFERVWEATVRALGTMPLSQQDRSAGLIVTEWFDPAAFTTAWRSEGAWPGVSDESDHERLRIRLYDKDEGPTVVRVDLARYGYTRDIASDSAGEQERHTWAVALPSTRPKLLLERIGTELAEIR